MSTSAAKGPNQILIIRHAEKPYTDANGTSYNGVNYGGNIDKHSLIPFGWQRAGAIAQFFTSINPVLTPNTAIASYPGAGSGNGDSHSWRPMQTIIPLLAKINQVPENGFYGAAPAFDPTPQTLSTCPFITQFDSSEWGSVASALPKLSGNVLIAWQHQDIVNLCKAIGTVFVIANPNDIPEQWPGTRFDIVFRFLLQPSTGSYQFSQIPQLLMPGDSPLPIPIKSASDTDSPA